MNNMAELSRLYQAALEHRRSVIENDVLLTEEDEHELQEAVSAEWAALALAWLNNA